MDIINWIKWAGPLTDLVHCSSQEHSNSCIFSSQTMAYYPLKVMCLPHTGIPYQREAKNQDQAKYPLNLLQISKGRNSEGIFGHIDSFNTTPVS
jgi:hypothetical protein